MTEKLKIVQFQGTNVKRLNAVDISFTENGVTVIGGANKQGKTSIIDLIMCIVKGNKFNPPTPVKDGAEEGACNLTLSNGLVLRKRFKDDKASLKVKGCSGSPQKFLTELFGEHALDIREFMLSDNKKKGQILMKLANLDFTELDAAYAELYEERRVANSEVNRLKKVIESLVSYTDVPEEELNTVELMRELQDIQNSKLTLSQSISTDANTVDDLNSELSNFDSELERVEMRLKELKEDIIPRVTKLRDGASDALEAKRVAFDEANYDERIEGIEQQVSGAEETNAKVRANKEYALRDEELSSSKEQADEKDACVKANREERVRMLEEARMPIPDLSVNDGLITYQGLQWDDLSTSEQFMIGTAIQASLKPSAPIVLLDHMEAFDTENLRKYSAWCAKRGYQVIGTRVSDGNECDYIITDGEVERP